MSVLKVKQRENEREIDQQREGERESNERGREKEKRYRSENRERKRRVKGLCLNFRVSEYSKYNTRGRERDKRKAKEWRGKNREFQRRKETRKEMKEGVRWRKEIDLKIEGEKERVRRVKVGKREREGGWMADDF